MENLGLFGLRHAVLVAALMSGLASCGGGGSATPGNSSVPTTITSMIPVGLVASANSQSLSILGTNFSDGMTVSVTDRNGTSYAVDTVMISSPTNVITANVTVTSTAPADNYLNVTVKSSSGAPLASAVLGVASAPSTLVGNVQSIFDTKCRSCHTNLAVGNLDLDSSTASASGLIGIPSYQCSPKFRVVPGDPRRSSSVLIDKIQAFNGQLACFGDPMPRGGPSLSATEIQTIIDWVALGAN